MTAKSATQQDDPDLLPSQESHSSAHDHIAFQRVTSQLMVQGHLTTGPNHAIGNIITSGSGAGMQSAFRSRMTTWLALVVLVSQFALSFAHHHSRPISAVVTGFNDQFNPGDERGGLPGDEENCAICWTTAIASALIEPGALILPAPSGEPILTPIPVARAAAVRCCASFQARAPPVVTLV